MICLNNLNYFRTRIDEIKGESGRSYLLDRGQFPAS